MTSQIYNQSIIPSTDVMQFTLTLKMTTAQVVETSVTVNNNNPIQDYIHPDDQTQPLFNFFNQQTLQVETDAKDRKETLKDTLQSSNSIRESQETLFPREDENEQQAKITVHTIEEAMTTTKERTPVSVWCGYDNALSF